MPASSVTGGPVVVGIDGTSGSAGALRYAAAQAVERGCGVHLVHVGPGYVPVTPMLPYLPEGVDEAGRAILQEAVAAVTKAATGLVVTTTLAQGSRIAELVAAARQGRLLVVGRDDRRGVDRLVSPATTAAVTARSPVPVVVVPAGWEVSGPGGRIVVGLRSSAHSARVLDAAFERARACGATLEVVHAWKLPDPYADRIEERTHAASWTVEGTGLVKQELTWWRAEYSEVPVVVRVEHDVAARALLRAAEGATLVLLARPPGWQFLGPHLGGTARAVLAAAPCPVEVVPGGGSHHS